ncbi:MAG: CBS domain-containing protein [Planctomycetes bacterium]|nr:CBS domain-containing protein [Planctomycetota bacterium]
MQLPPWMPRWGRFILLGAFAGIAGGLAAAGFEWGLTHGAQLLVGRFTHLGSAGVLNFRWGVLLLPALGGLISGIAVRLLCPQAFGHGTDLLVRAFHHDLGRLKLRGPIVKSAAAIWVIACGGSAGPEGPIAALGAAIGSTIGRVFGVSPRERRVLLIAGCAAGIGAIFQCPLGGALFAASVLYREPEFESEAIVPSVVASVMGYSTFMLFFGFGEPMLHGASALAFSSPLELIPYAFLGLLCGCVSIFFSYCLSTVETKWLPWSRLPRWLAPMFGGLATGALACLLPQVMDGQYRFIQNAMMAPGTVPNFFAEGTAPNWWWWAAMFGAVAIVKCIATAMTLGSGASGGVLGPAVFVGGTIGACVGALCEAAMPGIFPEGLREALIPVGMGGVLAASMRTPLAAIVMITEMTGSYGLIVPLMLVCISAYVVGRGWGLNHEQVRGAAESPAHAGDAIVHVLESWQVEQLMDRDWKLTVSPKTPLAELLHKTQYGTHPVFAVADDGMLRGLISTSDIVRSTDEPHLGEIVIAMDMMHAVSSSVFPDESIYDALNLFRSSDQEVLPVVSREPNRRWLGMLTRNQVFKRVREHFSEMEKLIMREHHGLAAINREGQLHELLTGMAPKRGHELQRLFVPLQAIGKSLRDADFRREFGVQVVAIEQSDGSLQSPPDVDTPLRTDQRLVVLMRRPEMADNEDVAAIEGGNDV